MSLYFLDTSVLVVLVRWNDLGKLINERYELLERAERPLISIVSHGELRSMARRNGWGEKKLAGVEAALTSFVTVDINQKRVIESYVRIDKAAHEFPKGDLNPGKNDLWIAASACAAEATLIATDTDFVRMGQGLFSVEYVDPAIVKAPKE
jgi:tRNA(fMet)-specific endonuclease VapC